MNPFADTLGFLLRREWPIYVFWVLLVGNIGIALFNLASDPTQRTLRHVWMWLLRLLIGGLWWQQTRRCQVCYGVRLQRSWSLRPPVLFKLTLPDAIQPKCFLYPTVMAVGHHVCDTIKLWHQAGRNYSWFRALRSAVVCNCDGALFSDRRGECFKTRRQLNSANRGIGKAD
jgi:hypothetical protein